MSLGLHGIHYFSPYHSNSIEMTDEETSLFHESEHLCCRLMAENREKIAYFILNLEGWDIFSLPKCFAEKCPAFFDLALLALGRKLSSLRVNSPFKAWIHDFFVRCALHISRDWKVGNVGDWREKDAL